MNPNTNINSKIKQKITEHEFPFSEDSWGKMEALLEEKKTNQYAKIKTIFIMTTIIILLSLLFAKMASTSENPEIENFKIEAIAGDEILPEKVIIEDTLIPETQFAENQQNHNQSKIVYPKTLKNTDSLLNKNEISKKNIFDDFTPIPHEKIYLHLDRTFYKPGEAIWFTAYLRDANSLKVSEISDIFHVELLAPNGNSLKKLKLIAENGIAIGDIQMDPNWVGGTYKIKAYTNYQKNFDEYFERDIQVQKTILPNLRMELDFDRETYGIGEKVIAKLNLNTLSNQPLSDHDFNYQVNLDGEKTFQNTGKTNSKGKAKIEFDLPENLETNDGLLNILISHNGQNESISRSIPIILNQIDLQFLPEGGQLIAGLPTRIAFKALNEFGKPADLEGIILKENGEQISTFKSYHQGMGRFDFLPELGERYFAKITNPKGVKELFELPEILEEGIVLNIESIDNETVECKIAGTLKVPAIWKGIAILRHGDTIYEEKEILKTSQDLIFSTKKLPIGISQITIFDKNKKPLAERLIFVNPHKKLAVEIKTDKEKYLPREQVNMDISIKNEKDEPVEGNFSLAVCDDKLLSFADDKQGHILSNILLESELKGEIIEPNFYFENKEKHPEKDQKLALDLLMMTQGWRRVGIGEEERDVADLEFENEETVLAGVVTDYWGNILRGTKLVFKETIIYSDSLGNFEFKNMRKSDFRTPFYAYYKGIETKSIFSQFTKNYKLKYSQYADLGARSNYSISRKETSENSRIIGSVTEYNLKSKIPFVNIAIQKRGEKIKIIESDVEGVFQIDNLSSGKYKLTVYSLGYEHLEIQNIEVRDGEEVNLSIKLADNGKDLSPIVVTALGVRKEEKAVGYAVQKIAGVSTNGKTKKNARKRKIASKDFLKEIKDKDSNLLSAIGTGNEIKQKGKTLTSDQIKNIPTRSVNALAAIAGEVKSEEEAVNIRGSRLNGTKYYADGIRIRGWTSTSNFPEPLYILDGVPVSSKKIEKLNTKEIKEITVLKDQNASAIYGITGKNGVILIFTEKEKKRKKNVDLENVRNVFNETIEEYEIAKNEYLDDKELSFLGLQNGLLSESELKKLNEDLKRQKNEIRGLENRLEICNSLLKEDKYFHFRFKEIEELKNYQKSLKFKTGFYTPREFYQPKFRRRDSLSTRFDFRNTIYWNPKIQTNKNGKATVQFFTSDAITTFRATLEGIGNNGKIGRAEHYFYNQPELGLQIKMPTNLVTGDEVKIPVTISNNSENLMEGDLTQFLPKGMTILGAVANPPSGFSKGEKPFGGLETAPKVAVALAAKESKTIFLNYQIENNAESGNFGLRFETKNGEKDELFQSISIDSRGFPVEEVFGGSSLEETFDVPIINPVEGSLNATFTVYPNVVGEVLEGMERMLRQPTGCFEQTSSANYPNVLVLNYLQEVGADMPEAEKRAMEYLEKGYKRLLGFEVTGGGFDWYGKPPAHEGLTAYGLMEFVDMSKVFQVESDLIERTAKWLLSRRNGNGGWQRSTKKAYRFNAQGIGDTYICWAMSEAGFGRKIQKEIEVAFENAIESEDPYLMGLMLNVLENEKFSNSKIAALKSKLIQLQNEDGSWTGKTTSIMNSRGRGLTIETTSLVTLGLLKDFENNRFYMKNAIKFIQKSKTGHGFGSTQSTILAMKTLIEYAKFSKSYNEGGEVVLMINGEKVEVKSYQSNQNEKLIFENLDQFLRKENNKVKVKFSNTKKALTYDLAISYATRQPLNSEKCLVDLETKLQNKSIKMGETARFSTIIKNTHDEPIPNTIAIIGIPAGLSLQPWQLKEMQEKTLFDYYEIMPNGNIAFHFRDMEAAEKVEINLDLKADIPGIFEAPASSAYLYYWNEEQVWSKPERVEIIQ